MLSESKIQSRNGQKIASSPFLQKGNIGIAKNYRVISLTWNANGSQDMFGVAGRIWAMAPRPEPP